MQQLGGEINWKGSIELWNYFGAIVRPGLYKNQLELT